MNYYPYKALPNLTLILLLLVQKLMTVILVQNVPGFDFIGEVDFDVLIFCQQEFYKASFGFF